MKPEKIQAMLRAEPFTPFRITLTTGLTYDVTLPNLTMATRPRLIIGFPAEDSGGRWADDCVWIGWSQIQSVERLSSQGTVA